MNRCNLWDLLLLKENTLLMNKINITYVDFDDTIFIWDTTIKTNIRPIIAWNDYDDHGRLNRSLIEYLNVIKNTDKIILLSHCPDSIELKIKKEYLENKCPGLFDDFIGTSSPERKIDIMAKSEEIYGIQPQNITLIDDIHATRKLDLTAGYLVKNPLEIANKYYEIYARICKAKETRD